MTEWWYSEQNLRWFKEWAEHSHRHLLRTKGMRRKTNVELALTKSRVQLGLSYCAECEEASKWTWEEL